jgi:hypothetical protein
MLLFTILILHRAAYSTVKAAAINTIHYNTLPDSSVPQLYSVSQEDATKELAVYVKTSVTTDVAMTPSASTGLSAMLDDRNIVAIAGITSVQAVATSCIAAWIVCLSAIVVVLAIVYSKYLLLQCDYVIYISLRPHLSI